MNTYPDRINELNYGTEKQQPSYQTEFPHDLPYDPGATTSLFELNYIPSKGFSPLLIVIVVCVLLYYFNRQKIKLAYIGATLLSIALSLVFLGPLRLPSVFRFTTVLGLAKFISLLLLGLSGIIALTKRSLYGILNCRTVGIIGIYLVSLLLSVFAMTNAEYFMQDFGMVITGLIFFVISYIFWSLEEMKKLILFLAAATGVASLFVYIVFIFRNYGVSLIGLLYPKYETSVFLHDLSRGRFFSVIDFEYFIACAMAIFILYRSKPYMRLIATALIVFSLGAIFLVNYRYRLLTFIAGMALMWVIVKPYRKIYQQYIGTAIVVICALYFGLSLIFSRSTFLDRFFLRNYYEDQVSVERRLYMYRQAIDLFIEHPFIGVGMGNYKDNVNVVYSNFGGRTYEPYYKILQNVYAYPHNWFLTVLAENGIVGFVIVVWMLGWFAIIDIRLSKRLDGERLAVFGALSCISWTYVFANNFTMMHVSLPMVIFFWATRGMIERMFYGTFTENGTPHSTVSTAQRNTAKRRLLRHSTQ